MNDYRQNVSIKGNKDGLIFLLNEDCSFEDLIEEIKDKLQNSHQGILTGPLTKVIIKTGYRNLSNDQREILKEVFKARGNLIIKSIENEIDNLKVKLKDNAKVITGIIRSGQIKSYETSVVFIGDVNPGGIINSFGNIYIFGKLKGTAHAGIDGDTKAIIVASEIDKANIRIANYISNYDKEEFHDSNIFAYIEQEKIKLKSIQELPKLKFELTV